MPRVAKPLGAMAIKRLDEPGYHSVGTVPGLYLQISQAKSKSWILRVTIGARRREIGLGGYPAVTLQEAHEASRRQVQMIRDGIDPVESKRASRSALFADQARAVTFRSCALAYIEAHERGWRNPKHAQQWSNTLETYAYPVIGDMLVRDVDTANVLAVLGPIWHSKTETAKRLKGRIESVLDWATTRQYREGPNPARWKGHLSNLLPAANKVATRSHQPALAVGDLPEFMASLRQQAGIGARALEFTILTATRSGEARGATWSEVDLKQALWTIPGTRMKEGKEHRVPLSATALEVLRGMPRLAESDLIFVSPRGGLLSDMTLNSVIKRMNASQVGRWQDPRTLRPVVPHGFRSTFRDWFSEKTSHTSEVGEMCLAHTVGNAVEAAYRRGDLLERRRQVMSDWAAFADATETSDLGVPASD